MSLKQIEILEGAFVISDAHYSHLRPELLSLIKDIHSKKILPTQLIFMGDIFDALFGEVPYTHRINEEMITLINEINRDMKVIYLEGNHDFNLSSVFPKAEVISYNQQPLYCSYKDEQVCLAHGDFDVGFFYSLYTNIIRNRIVLFLLKSFDLLTNHTIFQKLDKYLSKKDDCKEFFGFKDFIETRHLSAFECEYFIEGHFHQNKSYNFATLNYVNLAAFACNQRYFIVKSSQDNKLFLEEKSYKEI